MKQALLILILSILTLHLAAQELNCRVEVMSQRVQNVDPQVFKTLEQSVYEFLNNQKWTTEKYKIEERIECSIMINVMEQQGQDNYKASLNIQSSRPVFNSSYNTTVINHVDNEFVFEYVEFEPLQFNPNTFTSNLTSLLSFYAYLVIAMDMETFAPNGGEEYLNMAQSIINNVPQNLGDKAPGWRPFESNNNRYWIIENIMNRRFTGLRETYYEYHINGLDKMYENPIEGRNNVLAALEKLKPIVEQSPNSIGLQMFFNAKKNELIKMFSGAPSNEKVKAQQLLREVNPGKSEDYNAITQ
ncbi:MAG: DUF4835 family protein [Chitinophagales bacterium]